MIAEFFLSAKAKAILGILLVYCIVIEADKSLHKVESKKDVPKIEADTLLTKKDSLRLNLDKTIEKAEKATKQLYKVCKKS